MWLHTCAQAHVNQCLCVRCCILFRSCLEDLIRFLAALPSDPGWMPHTDRSPGKNPGCVIRPVGSAVPTPVCKLSDSGDNTACHKLRLWHPARHLLVLQGSATGAAFPPEVPKPAPEGSSLQMPTDPGGTAHPLYNRGQALSTSSLSLLRGLPTCPIFMASRDAFAGIETSGLKGPGLALE